MSCWNYLGLEPTSEKRLIKKAYAAKLKTHKPDEDPEGFSKLNANYKIALKQAQYLQNELSPGEKISPNIIVENSVQIEEAVPQERFPTNDIKHTLNEAEKQTYIYKDTDLENAEIAPHSITEEEPDLSEQELDQGKEYIDLEATWGQLTQRVNSITKDIELVNKEELWFFLDESEAMYDIEFKAHFSNYIFNALLDIRKKHPRKKLPIAKTLNKYFRWTDKKEVLEMQYEYIPVQQLLEEIEGIRKKRVKWICDKTHKGPKVFGDYYARLSATAIDLVFLAITQYVLKLIAAFLGIQHSLFNSGELHLFILLYVVLIPLLEASPLQGSIGKVLLGMKITNLKGKRLNILHAFWRNISYLISTACFKITIWINMFTNDGKMVHDRASRSLVLKR